MLRSSLGFHTLTLSRPVFLQEAQYLISDFKRYSKETGAIQIFQDHGNLRIEFLNRAEGISWLIRSDVWLEGFKMFVDIVEVTINPKILGGIRDYITAVTYDDMAVAIDNFNCISASITPALGSFEQYRLKRIDYRFNCALNELAPGCTYDQMMKLIKQSDIPPHYKEWKEHDDTSHRMKSRPSSFYLTNDSVHINCYSKYMSTWTNHKKHREGIPSYPAGDNERPQDIIRFEIQCKYLKTYTLSRKANEDGDDNINHYRSLLNHATCKDQISAYYNRTIGRSDWYTLQEAIRMIHSKHFHSQKDERLIRALKLVNDCRSIAKAKAAYQGSDLAAFKRTLGDLASLGINPVTIPREWGIKHIPNLLYAYFDKVSEERINKQWEEEFILNYKKYAEDMRAI